MLVAPVFRVSVASSTGVSTSANVLVAQVLTTMVLVAGSTGATFIEAPMLLTMCYKYLQASKLKIHCYIVVQFTKLLAQ